HHEEEQTSELDHTEWEKEEHSPEVPSSEESLEVESGHSETEVMAASSGDIIAKAAVSEEPELLLPGETRAPHTSRGPSGSREDYPRDSARIGGNPRSRFHRPFRRDRGGRPDRHGGDHGRQRFDS